jgi:hydroxylysine kinase
MAALPALITGRIALSVAHGAAAALRQPSNAAYVLTTQRPGWALLASLAALPKGALAAELVTTTTGA